MGCDHITVKCALVEEVINGEHSAKIEFMTTLYRRFTIVIVVKGEV